MLALVFQHTWAEGLLDVTSPGYVVSWTPLFLFVILPSIMVLLGRKAWWPSKIPAAQAVQAPPQREFAGV